MEVSTANYIGSLTSYFLVATFSALFTYPKKLFPKNMFFQYGSATERGLVLERGNLTVWRQAVIF